MSSFFTTLEKSRNVTMEPAGSWDSPLCMTTIKRRRVVQFPNGKIVTILVCFRNGVKAYKEYLIEYKGRKRRIWIHLHGNRIVKERFSKAANSWIMVKSKPLQSKHRKKNSSTTMKKVLQSHPLHGSN